MKNVKKRGFTLIELLVVVLIIGILAAVAVPQYQLAVKKSQFVQLMAFMESLEKSMSVYYLANGEWATDLRKLDIDFPGIKGPTQFKYQQYNCYLYNGETTMSDSINCWMEDNISYRWFFPSGTKHCEARKTSSWANSVCKLIGGTFAYDSDVRKIYKL